MKITFTTPLDYTDGTAIQGPALAAASYSLFVDTVNPPVKKYAVPPANLAAATTNADGSKTVTVDAAKDLGIAVAIGTTYYIAAEDTVNSTPSAETPILDYVYQPTPNAPGNFSVA